MNADQLISVLASLAVLVLIVGVLGMMTGKLFNKNVSVFFFGSWLLKQLRSLLAALCFWLGNFVSPNRRRRR